MRLAGVEEAVFLRRNNRFTAEVLVGGRTETVHVKNTGRLRELLRPGARVWLQRAAKPERKTAWDLIAAAAGDGVVNVDSQLPNALAEEWVRGGGLFPEPSLVRREVTHGDSRFDLYAEHDGRRAFIEVKGVTLVRGGVALFPDAPTERGVKHLRGLSRCAAEGDEAWVLFVIARADAVAFAPNAETDPAFAQALRAAVAGGVQAMALSCAVTPDSVMLADRVPVCLDGPAEGGCAWAST